MAVSFELPPSTASPKTTFLSPVRYQDTLPPITPTGENLETERNLETEKNLADEQMPTAPMRKNNQPIAASDFAQSATIESEVISLPAEKIVEQTTENIQPSEKEDIALQFAQDNVAIPVVGQVQGEKVSTLPEAFAVESAADKLLVISSKHSPTLVGSSGMVRSLQQRLTASNSESNTSTANLLQADILEDWIYEGGSNSLVARTVGSAEGTRKSNGERTKAYYGHVDPGNGVWNLGTFSYQHEASSPEDADEKQLKRLQRQEHQLKEKAAQWKVPLSIEVRLNGLDLANQAPLAALDEGGYIERLAEAYANGKSGEAAIVWARTQAYFDPHKQAWDAPGLGNNRYSIQRDQERRMAAIDSALRRYKDEHVGATSNLLRASVASANVATENSLLDKPDLSNTDSLNGIDFSLEAASPDISRYVSKSVVNDSEANNNEANNSKANETEPQMQPVNPIAVREANVLEANALEADTLKADTLATDTLTADNTDSSLAVESDLADLSQVSLGKWDEGYETAASETTNLIEAESVPLDDGLAFENDEIASLLVPGDHEIATQAANTDLAETELKLAPIANVLEQQETSSLLEKAQHETQDENLIEAKLDRLLEGIEPGDRSQSF